MDNDILIPAEQAPEFFSERTAEPAENDGQAQLPFIVIGIGASAGGLEAFIDFFQDLPAETGMAYVLVQHLSNSRESMVSEILGGRTQMPVFEAEEGMSVEPNHVYVIRAGYTMTIRKGCLHLKETTVSPGHPVQIDDFFRSLATEQRERAIGILLSGMGSDGTAGAQAIRAVGGLCIAQDPETTKYPSMPRSLIDAGAADFILKLKDMPAVLERYGRHPYSKGEPRSESQSEQDRAAYTELLAVLRNRGGVDFSGYKKATMDRRIARRMSMGEILTLADYLRFLRQSGTEIGALADDMLIHVTGFFRDPEVWEALREQFIVPLVQERPGDSLIRGWVTACSSGEEAYTLGMLLLEAAEAAGKTFEIKIFATDAAERSLNYARAGLYPAGIESELSPERLVRFFDKEDSFYRIKKELREKVVFAEQNILKDPPFSRLDICTCRNLLIYLQPDVQQRALAMLHFGLRESGILLLGNSETVAGSEELFDTLDKKNRIFRRIGAARHGLVDFTPAREFSVSSTTANPPGDPPSPRLGLAQLTHKTMSERFGPPSVVIDRAQRIVYFQGQTERYIDPPRGEPTREILALVREPYRSVVRSAVQKALADDAPATVRDGLIDTPEGPSRLEISVVPLDSRTSPSLFLVSFLVRPELAPAKPVPSAVAGNPSSEHDELQRVRHELQDVIEQLQSSNGELRSSNEETVSINEELQSTVEELETSKEELQSLNEELTTVNAQLQVKFDQLETTTSDLTSLLSSTSIGVIFLDTQLRIRRFTPAVRDLFDLIPADTGRPLSALARQFRDDGLLDDAQRVLDHLAPMEKEVQSDSGRTYLRRALPYRSNDHRIEGVVLTFIEVTEQKKSEMALRISEEQHRLIVQGVHDYAIFMLDPSGKIVTWSPSAERIIGYEPRDALGRTLVLMATPEDDAAGVVKNEVAEAMDRGSTRIERWHQRRDGTRFWGVGMLSALRGPDGELRGFVKTLRDNTEKKITDEALQVAKHAAESANDAKDEFLANVSHELRTPLSAILLWTKLLGEGNYDDVSQLKAGFDIIRSCAMEQQSLIEDLVDTSRIASGKLSLDLASVDLSHTFDNLIKSTRVTALVKGVKFLTEIDPACGLVSADQKRLQQIVANLLNNAVKFSTDSGTIVLSLQRTGEEVKIEVADTGMGIDPGFIGQIFQRFTQAADATTRVNSGLGLGLAITRQLVELHGGNIVARSEGLGQGAQFTVRLPLPSIDAQTRTSSSSADVFGKSSPRFEGRRILLIEDSNETREALATFLRQAGAEVSEHTSASSAIAEYQRLCPHYILSDLGLPKIDGHDLIRFIRAWEKEHKLARVPALALTAYADEKNRRKALQCGFDNVLTKPVDLEKLLRSLAQFNPATSK